ncbi:hypothetical protein Tco_1089524 [Tanacetum coccineum]
MSSKDPEEVNTESDFNDETTHASGSMKIEEEAKVEAARRKGEIRKEELFDLLGPEVVNKYYNDKLQEDDTSETIPEFKASDLHLGEWREVVTTFLNKKDRLNDLANEKRKHADDIHDFLRANKRLKSSVKYKDHPTYTVLNEPVLEEILFRLYQGPRLDDYAMTFSSLLLAEIDKRNLNPRKQMRVIEQLRQ